MSQMTRLLTTGGVLLTLCGGLFGCSARTYVSGTGSTPSQFTHVYITTQEVWFNTNSNASADGSGWTKFPLTNPVTIDLVQESNGTLGQIAGDLTLAPGTYNTILLLPLPNTSALATSASALGAANNLEADFVDPSGNPHTVPLILPNPEKGIVVPGASLKVPVGGATLPSSTSTTSSTTSTSTTSTTGTTGTSTSSTSQTITVSFAANFDGNRDLHLFDYPTTTSATTPTQSVLLSSDPAASDLSTTGGISGTLTLTSLTAINSISDRVGIQACAESLDNPSSPTHHVIVACAPVQTDGTFTIYPLPSNSTTPTVYDVVIHGFGIQTIIIKSVSVTTTTPSIAAAANTTGAVATTTASGAVSLGTFIPNASNISGSTTSTGWFYVNLKTGTSGLPAGMAVTFYQTLQGSNEYPYAIDEVGIDPFNQNLASPEPLATGNIESGTYSSSGSTITVTSTAPVQGSSTYTVGATAPLFTDAIGTSTVVPTATSQVFTSNQASVSTSNLVYATVPSLSPANSAAVGSISATISMGAYTQGELLVSHNGAVIGSAAIASGAATVSGLPSGDGNYYLSLILWNTGAESTSVYQSVTSPVTVTAGSATPVTITVN